MNYYGILIRDLVGAGKDPDKYESTDEESRVIKGVREAPASAAETDAEGKAKKEAEAKAKKETEEKGSEGRDGG